MSSNWDNIFVTTTSSSSEWKKVLGRLVDDETNLSNRKFLYRPNENRRIKRIKFEYYKQFKDLCSWDDAFRVYV